MPAQPAVRLWCAMACALALSACVAPMQGVYGSAPAPYDPYYYPPGPTVIYQEPPVYPLYRPWPGYRVDPPPPPPPGWGWGHRPPPRPHDPPPRPGMRPPPPAQPQRPGPPPAQQPPPQRPPTAQEPPPRPRPNPGRPRNDDGSERPRFGERGS